MARFVLQKDNNENWNLHENTQQGKSRRHFQCNKKKVSNALKFHIDKFIHEYISVGLERIFIKFYLRHGNFVYVNKCFRIKCVIYFYVFFFFLSFRWFLSCFLCSLFRFEQKHQCFCYLKSNWMKNFKWNIFFCVQVWLHAPERFLFKLISVDISSQHKQ